MAELADLKPYQLPDYVQQPIPPSSYFNRQLPASPLEGINQVLGNLPQNLMQSYQFGRQMQIQRTQQTMLNQIMGGGGVGAAGSGVHWEMGPQGINLSSKSPMDQFYEQERIQALQNKNDAGNVQQQLNSIPLEGGVPQASTETPQNGALTGDATVFGLVPDGEGGYKDDPNDVTDAATPGFDPTKGAWGANIKDPSLKAVAVSPQLLSANGVDTSKGNVDANGLLASHAVEATLPDGRTMTYPIADKKGGSGVDATYAAYNEMGGPQETNGGVIPGVKYRIVPRTPDAATGSIPAADAINAAAMATGSQLGAIPIGDLSAGSASGPVPATNISVPLDQFYSNLQKQGVNIPVERPGRALDVDPATGNVIAAYDSLPGSSKTLMRYADGAKMGKAIYGDDDDAMAILQKHGITEQELANATPGQLSQALDAASHPWKGAVAPSVRQAMSFTPEKYAQALAVDQDPLDPKLRDEMVGHGLPVNDPNTGLPLSSSQAAQMYGDYRAKNGILTDRQNDVMDKMQDKMAGDKTVKDVMDIHSALNQARSAFADPNLDSANAKVLLESFLQATNEGRPANARLMGMMKQGSTVRQSFDNLMANLKGTSDTTLITQEQRKQAMDALTAAAGTHQKDFQDAIQQYTDRAKREGIPLDHVNNMVERYQNAASDLAPAAPDNGKAQIQNMQTILNDATASPTLKAAAQLKLGQIQQRLQQLQGQPAAAPPAGL